MLGSTVTRQLLEQGKDVRVLVRPQSQYQPLVEAGAQPVFGDLKDRASLDAACRGVDTIVTTANSASRGGDDNIQTVDQEGNRNLVDAAKEAGVKHFIFVSALGADPNSQVPFLQAKGQTEEQVRASGMDYTILAPNLYMEVWPQMVIGMPLQMGKPVTLVGEAQRKHSLVCMEDVAQYAVRSVDDPAARNQYLVIGGPEPMSWRDMAATYERVMGREIPLQFVPVGEPVPHLPETMNSLITTMEMYDSPIDMTELSRTFDVRPTSLEEFLRRQSK
jgi:NADH dehydrogenase